VHWEAIHKPSEHGDPRPNMGDYAAERAAFTWEGARRALDGLPSGRGLNIAHEAVDCHAAGPRRGHVALRCLDWTCERTEVTYAELAETSNRFANVLDTLGVEAGERVFVLMQRTADLYAAALGTLKHRSVLCPLFAAFGPEPIRQRLELGSGRVLVTTPTLYRHKVAAIRDQLPLLHHILLAGGSTAPETAEDVRTLDLDDVGAGETLQEALDLDSMDFLNFAVGLHEATGLEIPERHYPRLSTVEGCVTYLTSAG
jgi:acetyl-CoA synthetase